MKIVFMGTPEFALHTLKKLAASEHRVVSVITQPDRPKGRGRAPAASPVKQFAEKAGLPVLQPEKINTPEFLDTLRRLQPDFNIVVAYGKILKPELLDAPRRFSINLHASILPKFRGAAPIAWALINGETETGVTTIKMDAGMDTGDILQIRKIPIEDTDNAQTLHDQLADLGADLVLETLRRLEENSLTPVPQDDGNATYAPKLTKEDGRLLWDREARALHNRVRGLEPWPGAYTFFRSTRLRICKTDVVPGFPGDRPGIVARLTDYGIEVGTGKDRLAITELQPEGKKRMSAKSFLAGHPMNPGDPFESVAAGEPSPAR